MSSELYQQVLGENWLPLAENIRLAHSVGKEMNGTFRIAYGMGWMTKQLARWSHLPQAAEAADTRLTIFKDNSGERWERRFDGEAFITSQWKGKHEQLVERFGEWELHFKLRVEEGNLFYEQSGARFCLGALCIPMPRACAPSIFAKEMSDGGTRVLVSVRVTLPLVGLLISYEGHLNVRGET